MRFSMMSIVVALLVAATAMAAAMPRAPDGGAYQPAPRFESVGVGTIPRGVVPSIAQDRAGFLWVATGDGLVRHDGYRFRPQERDSADPAARNLGWVRAMLAGRDGRLWIGTESDGLVGYDPGDERVTDFGHGGVDAGASPAVLALAEDADGAIWVGTAGAGLHRFDPSARRFTVFRHQTQAGSLPDDRLAALLVDRQGTLWVGSWRGLSRRLRGSEVFETVHAAAAGPGGAGTVVQALFEADDGRIWAGTQGGDLAIVDPGTAQVTLLERGRDDAGAVTSFVQAPEGRIWVGRMSGIDVHDAADGRLLQRLRHDARQPAGLAGNAVTALLRDRAGALWIAGFGLGLQRHDPNQRAIWVRDADPAPASPLAQADVRSLLRLDDGSIWAATAGGGIAVLDTGLRVSGAVQPPLRAAAAASPAAAALPVDAMAQARDGTVWLGGDGTLRQHGRDGRALRALAHDGGATHHLAATADGTLWAATQDGVFRLPQDAAAPERVTLAGGTPLRGEAWVLAAAADGGLWVGSAKGLYHVPPGAKDLHAVASEPGAGLANPTVIGLLLDARGTLWVDTAVAGLHRLAAWDGRRARFDRISLRHGVYNRPFGVNLMADARGRIWTHMHVYDPAADRLDELTTADGVSFGTGWFRSHAATADGRLLVGGSKGVLVIEPARFEVSTHAPPLVVSELRMNGQRTRAGLLAQGLRVAPDQRSFSVEFAALEYSAPQRSRYAYRLEGFDPEWIATGAELRAASYSNLNPGDYVLRVRATNRSGVWSPHELAVPVHVQAAWWQQPAFRLALALLLAGAAYALVRWRLHRLAAAKAVLEQTVRARTADLEAMTEALRRESAALAEASLTDPLTGLRNRRFLTQHIDADVALAVRRHAAAVQAGVPAPDDADLVFFIVDLDAFKRVNDEHGHAAGDHVIGQIRDRLQRVFRDSDHLVRWGGEEFLIVARGTSRQHAAELAERVRATIADQPFRLTDGTLLDKTCSVGFCCFPLAPHWPDALGWGDAIQAADAALYLVKQGGRDGWLGLVSAEAPSAEALAAASRQALPDWARSGAVTVAVSPGHAGWAGAPTAPSAPPA